MERLLNDQGAERGLGLSWMKVENKTVTGGIHHIDNCQFQHLDIVNFIPGIASICLQLIQSCSV